MWLMLVPNFWFSHLWSWICWDGMHVPAHQVIQQCWGSKLRASCKLASILQTASYTFSVIKNVLISESVCATCSQLFAGFLISRFENSSAITKQYSKIVLYFQIQFSIIRLVYNSGAKSFFYEKCLISINIKPAFLPCTLTYNLLRNLFSTLSHHL